MADVKVTIDMWVTTVDDPDKEEIHDDLRVLMEDFKTDCEEILSLDRMNISVEDDD